MNARQHCNLYAALTLLCLSAGVSAHAAESGGASPKLSVSQWLPSAAGLKERLTWLREFTVKELFPKQDLTGAPAGTADILTGFDAQHLPFKSVDAETYSNTLKKLLKQQFGVQVAPNTLFQCDLRRYRNVDDRQEVAIKLGIHVDFR